MKALVFDRGEDCLSDLALDRLLAGELAGAEGARIEAHLAGCERCAARHAAIAADAARFQEEIFVAGVAARTAREARRPAWRWVGGAIAAAAALVLVAVLPSWDGGVRTKGGGALDLIARTKDGRITRVLPGDPLAPGDALRFEVKAPADGWVAIVGIDSAMVVTPYVPGADVAGGEALVLPGSIELDATLGPERIVALFCDGPVHRETLVRAGERALAKANGDPVAVSGLGVDGCVQSSVLIRKVAR